MPIDLPEDTPSWRDYRRILGAPAREIVRVRLIANSLFQRGHGRCECASIRRADDEPTLVVL